MSGDVSFDFGAFLREIEWSAVKAMISNMAAHTDMPPEQRKITLAALEVFQRHGIRATEAIAIIAELGGAINDAQRT